jgi:hypothetical protein
MYCQLIEEVVMATVKLRPSSRTWWDHLRARIADRHREEGAQRQLRRIRSGMRKDMHAARRDAETAIANGRAELTSAAARSAEAALGRLARRPGSAGH